MWLNISAANEQSIEGRNGAIKRRDSMADYMSAEQIAEAQDAARKCTDRKFRDCSRN
jgi:hypothetical protein